MSKKIDLSIIIPSVNTRELLSNCLTSMTTAISKLNIEVIVIDSGSSDGTSDMVKKKYPWVKLIREDKTWHFGKNNNIGIKYSNGKYVLFLNSDTKIIEDNIFIDMVKWMDNHPRVAASSSSLTNSDLKILQASGGYFPTLPRVFSWMMFIDNLPFFDHIFKTYHPSKSYFYKPHNQDWITGAFYLVRKDVLDKVGGFDEDYNAYVEEVDLSYRIKKEGFEIYYLPYWKIVHYGGASYGSENSIIFEMNNLKVFYAKHYPKWQLPILNIIIKIGCLIRIMIFSLFRKNLVNIYAKAFKTI